MNSAGKTVLQQLDEALRVLELRRYRRILSSGRLPIVYSVAVFMAAGFLVPFLFGENGLLLGGARVSRPPTWGAGMLLTLTALAACVGAYFRSQYLWHQEAQMKTLHSWLLSGQNPGRAALTTVVMGALLGLALVAVPAAFGFGLGILMGMQWWQVLLYLLVLPLCALLGASLGAAVFFISQNLVPQRLLIPGALALVLLAVGLWFRIETVDNGWRRGWEEHPARVVKALLLISPVPSLYGASDPKWWNNYVSTGIGRGLGVSIPLPLGVLAYSLFLAGGSLYLTWLSMAGYRRLADDPDLIEEKPREPTETDEGGREFYWKGFKNPVWTRDVRTRLRSKETAEFIFFASIAVAAGAFVPLIMTARDLADPLQTAQAARQIFFWLTMTLIALVTLITPGLTADVITQERAQGTLEMLIGTALRPRDILIGKLLGAVSVMLLLISPSLPLFGLCYLFHGASGGQVVFVYGLVIVTLTISAFIGLAQSSINNKGGMAKFWAYALTSLFVGFPGGPFWIAAAAAATDPAMRQQLSSNISVTVLIAVFWILGLVLLWGNASEQLEYSEY